MIEMMNYPPDWDDETYTEIVCEICKKTSKHKLDYTFTSKAGYAAHMMRIHADRKEKRAKKPRCDEVMQSIQSHLDAAEKRNTSDDLTDKLTASIDNASMRGRDSETRVSKEDIKMAAKKKTAAKSKKIQTAEAIGRERKLLLRLSVDEYNGLQAKAAKQGVSMAMLLRSVI